MVDRPDPASMDDAAPPGVRHESRPPNTALPLKRRIGLLLGPILGIVVYTLIPSTLVGDAGDVVGGLSQAGRAVAAVGTLMAVLWVTEALPIPATALLPIALFPVLTGGVITVRAAAAPYAHDLIFLFMGGFMLAAAMQRWGLHRRIALRTILIIGTRPANLVGGFMIASAFLSMWVSNTATVVMMLPIAMSVVELVRQRLREPDDQHPSGVEVGSAVRTATTPRAAGFSPRGLTDARDVQTAGSAVRTTTPPRAAGGMESRSIGSPPALTAHREGQPFHFAICLMLGTAYAASIGGIGTLIGTPPNLLLAAFLSTEYDVEISFVRWLGVGVPLVLIFLPITWLLLTKVIYPIRVSTIPGERNVIKTELDKQGPMSRGEWMVLIVFLLTATAWITRPALTKLTLPSGAMPLAGLSDAGIAIIAAVAMFALPVNRSRGLKPARTSDPPSRRLQPARTPERADLPEPHHPTSLLSWEDAAKLPWGILILFGGGLSLASAVKTTGVAEYLGQCLSGLHALPVPLLLLMIISIVVFLTELTSNTATTATFLPILGALAIGLGISPALLVVPTAMAASCAFMMPVATPPNAIVFGSGEITIPQMCKAGLWLNLIGIALIMLLMYTVIIHVLGIDVG